MRLESESGSGVDLLCGGAVGIGSRVALETRGLMNDNETSTMDSQLKVNLSSVFC